MDSRKVAAGLLVCALGAWGEDKESAKRLLEAAVEMTSPLEPQVQVMALLHAGYHYTRIDGKRGGELLRQAFAASAQLPEDGDRGIRSQMQASIAKLAAVADVEVGMELLKQVTPPAAHSDPHTQAYVKIVGELVGKKELDRAVELLAGARTDIDYPFEAAGELLERLGAEDSRRAIVFGNAVTAFGQRAAPGFGRLVGQHWKKQPREQVERALQVLLQAVLNKKADGSFSFGLTENADGETVMQSAEMKELAAVWEALEKFEPGRAKELKQKHKELEKIRREVAREAKEEGKEEKKKEDGSGDFEEYLPLGFVAGLMKGGDMTKLYGDFLQSQRVIEQIEAIWRKNPKGALEKAKQVPLAGMRAEVVARIAGSVGKGDAQVARSAMSQAEEMLGEMKEPGDRLMARAQLGKAAQGLGDEEQAMRFFGGALEDAQLLYTAEAGNEAIMEEWVSVGGCRVAMNLAGKALGVKAEGLLAGMTNANLAVLGRIELAGALMGQGPTVHAMNVRRTEKDK